MVDSNNETIKKKKIVVKKKDVIDTGSANSFSDAELVEEMNKKAKSRVRKKTNAAPTSIEVVKGDIGFDEEVEEKKPKVVVTKNNVDLSTKLKNFRHNRKKRIVEVEKETPVEEKPKVKNEIKIETKKQKTTLDKNNKTEEKANKKVKDTSKNSKKEKTIEVNKTKGEKVRKEKLPDILFTPNPKLKDKGNKKEEKKEKAKDLEKKKPEKKEKKQSFQSEKTEKKKEIKTEKIALDYDEDRPKSRRVLKPQVSKVFTIISDILYWIIFIFIVILLFIVCVQRFSNNELSIGGIRIYNVSTESMLSKYAVGDIILAKDVDPSTLKIGDDIAYNGKAGQLEGKIITHEIQEITRNEDGSYTIITKGVQNDIEDPAINSSQVKGKIIRKLPILSTISRVASNNFGLFFAIFIPVAIIIFINMIRIMNATDEEE